MWSDYFRNGVIKTGELAGSGAAAQMPDVACRLIRFKARATNAGNVFLGVASTVSKADGTTDTTSGFELGPGEDTGWLVAENANRFWRICDNAGDAMTYMAVG